MLPFKILIFTIFVRVVVAVALFKKKVAYFDSNAQKNHQRNDFILFILEKRR